MYNTLYLALWRMGGAEYKDKDTIVFRNLEFRWEKSKMQINRDQTEYVSTIGKVQYFMNFLRKKKIIWLVRKMAFHAQCLLLHDGDGTVGEPWRKVYFFQLEMKERHSGQGTTRMEKHKGVFRDQWHPVVLEQMDLWEFVGKTPKTW